MFCHHTGKVVWYPGQADTVIRLITVVILFLMTRAFTSAGNPVEPGRCQPATLVEGAHTRAEHALYTALWNLGGPAERADAFREVSIGYDKLAALAGGSKPHVKRLVEALQRKLAIEVVGAENSGARRGKTYHVYGAAEILRRRREAGYRWRFRDRSAVELVKMTEEAASPSAEMPSAASDEDAALAEIRMWMGDDAAATQELIAHCRWADRNASAVEILHFMKIDVAALRRRGPIANWRESLITSVARYFQAPALELERYRTEHH
jgi:hypothetical protein